MKVERKSIPVIKTLIIFSVLVFITSLVYRNLFKPDDTIEISKKSKVSLEQKSTRAIDNFVNYVNTQPGVTFNRSFASTALMKLRKAIHAIAVAKGYEFQFADLVVAESDIIRISNEPLFSTRAYYLKHAAMILSSSLLKLQRQRFPELQEGAEALVETSKKFVGTDLKLQQDRRIRIFLNQAVALVERMK